MVTSSAGVEKDGFRELFTPKLISALREGYGLDRLRHDALAGLTVSIVALPLAMAIAIASGAGPEAGLTTAIIAGFLISALGGSRFQIGGPTAAFIVVVFDTIQSHGYDGLVLATLMAGVMLVGLGFLRLGTYIKYIPYPVVIGFTAGIAATICVSQIKDLLGLPGELPADLIDKVLALVPLLSLTNPAAVAVAILGFALMIGIRRFRPSWPFFLIAVVVTSAVVALLALDVPTIGSRFGGVPNHLPLPHLPAFDLGKVREVFSSAVTIALLAGIESLLSAVVADGMTGRRHRSNCELVAQGVANIASSLFGGLPATGAIARTATNIRAGARTPIAGMLHAVFLLAFMLVGSPLLSYIPLAVLSAILVLVAWNIAEIGHVRQILVGASLSDRALLLVTFALTILVDLTAAIEIGVVLAAFTFMHRMANAVEIETEHHLIEEDRPDSAKRDQPPITAGNHGIVVYRINGPFFFGATQKFSSTLSRIGQVPKAYVLDFSAVPFVDSTAAAALRSFVESVHHSGATVTLAGVGAGIRRSLSDYGVGVPMVGFARSVDEAVARLEATRPAG